MLKRIRNQRNLTEDIINFSLDPDFFSELDAKLDPETLKADKEKRDGVFGSAESPRNEYARRLVCAADKGILPEAVILRDRFSNALDLSNYSLGDDPVSTLSEVLDVMPYVTSLNLCNNRLTDIAIRKIVEAVCFKPGCGALKHLDLSENDLDEVSTRTLANFLENKNCKLEQLILRRADLDDAETQLFMASLEHNRSMQVLDLSRNDIGGHGL